MSPSENQRSLFERTPPKPLRGLDLWAHGVIGWCKGGRWARRRLAGVASAIAAQRDEFESLSDHDLNVLLASLRQGRRRTPDCWQKLRVKGLAALAVAAQRELGLRGYEVQLMAAAALVEGYFTEVDTGEGKTLAIGLAAGFLGWSGLPCHVLTANDYLAKRDATQLARFYQRIGLRAGYVLGEQDENARREGYACHVTYSTAKEVAADYLRDRLHGSASALSPQLLNLTTDTPQAQAPVQRGLYHALIDEADHALIDEAVTPLIISREQDAGAISTAAHAAWEVVRGLEKGLDYRVDLEARKIELLPEGIRQIRDGLALSQTGLWASDRRRLELVSLGLEAREFFLRDAQYVIDEGKVVIVDPGTGRPMPMRTWRQGLHQIIEAKEGLPISGPSETLARISFQAFFRKYQSIAGASGTLREAAAEIWQTYRAPLVSIPRHLPSQRYHAGVRYYLSRQLRDEALLHEVKYRHARGQPLLIGCRTVESSEQVAQFFKKEGFSAHQILNALRHREEAILVALAGEEGQLTIATGMAGRGTDIRLGDGVAQLGGLHVISTEANESSRVDRQLFGRSARQGDPGSMIAFYEVDDAVFKRFIPSLVHRVWRRTFELRLYYMSQVMGSCLLWWVHRSADRLAVRQRRQVMLAEEEVRRSLGFTMGRRSKHVSHK